MAVNALFTALARDVVTFNVFRIIGGIGVGLCSIASPLYIAEVSPPERRGALGFMYHLAIVVGMVLSIIVAYLLAAHLPAATSWRWMFGSQMAAIALFVVFLALIPETPRWLAAQGRDEAARSVLARIGGGDYPERQMGEIRGALREEAGTFGELFAPGMRLALAVG